MKFVITHYTKLTERYVHIVNQMKTAGITDYEIIKTHDRDDLTHNEIIKFSKITNSEISLFLKHIEIFKTAPEDEIIVVFEDDAILCENFMNKMNLCISQLEQVEWDVLFSGECCNLHYKPESGKNIKKSIGSRGTCMYILNTGVGKKLYNIFNSQPVISNQIDWWFNKIMVDNKLQYYWSEPTLVSQGSDGLFKTAIVHS